MTYEVWDIWPRSDELIQTVLDSGADFHLGVITADTWTDTQSGILSNNSGYPWIDNDTPDPHLAFSQNLEVPYYGAEPERGIDATWLALVERKDKENLGFLREEASLHVMTMSDENDQSKDTTVGELVDYLASLGKPDVTYSSIVHLLPGQSACALTPPEEPGTKYMAVTNEVGGWTVDICTNTWITALTEILDDISHPAWEFHLTDTPLPHTLEVEVVTEGTTIQYFSPNDWVYDPVRNSIQFTTLWPEPGATVVVTYILDE